MKSLIHFGIWSYVMAVLLVSCNKEEESVKACFNYSITEVTTGEVQFINCSENAISYLWDFGDGKTSTEKEPLHIFEGGFPFTVKLIASNGDKSDAYTLQITSQIMVYKPNIYFYPIKSQDLCINISFPLGG